MRLLKRILIALAACFGAIALGILPTVSTDGVTASAQLQSRVEVYERIEGVKQGYASADGMQTDGFSLSVTLDIPSNNLAYVGIKASAAGSGLAASGTPALAIALYNSNDRCLAMEIYSGRSWKQLTATTEFTGIAQTERISLALKKTDGVWGLYLNGELYTGPAKGGLDGVEAGAKINPLEYIAESEFSTDGVSYFETGTWTGGGAITVNKQVLSGSFALFDREREAMKNVSLVAAYNAVGNVIPLIDQKIENGNFTVSTLSADTVESFLVETAGGVQRTVESGETLAVKDNDLSLTVKDGDELLDGVTLKVERAGADVTDGVTVQRTDNGYLLWDIAGEVTLTLTRDGYKTQKATVPAGVSEYTVTLEKRAFNVQVQAFDRDTGERVRIPAENLTVFKDGAVLVGVSVFENAGVIMIGGLSGKTGTLTLKAAAYGDYPAAEKTFDESFEKNGLTLYLQKQYAATVTVKNVSGEALTAASVKLGETLCAGNGGVYTLTGLVGDRLATVSAEGYATAQVLVTPTNAEITVVLQSLGAGLFLPIDGVENGVSVRYTVNGLSTFEARKENGGITLDPSVKAGDTVAALIDGYAMTTSTVVVGGEKALAAEKVHDVQMTFLYNGAPVANAAVTLDRASLTTDENGCIALRVIGDDTVKVLAVEGFKRLVNNELDTADGTELVVALEEKIYKAIVTVKDADGNVVSDLNVYIGDKKARKENGAFVVDGLTGVQTVVVEGTTLSGTVNETDNALTLTIVNTADDTPTPTQSGGCNAGLSGATALIGAVIVAIASGKRRMRRA